MSSFSNFPSRIEDTTLNIVLCESTWDLEHEDLKLAQRLDAKEGKELRAIKRGHYHKRLMGYLALLRCKAQNIRFPPGSADSPDSDASGPGFPGEGKADHRRIPSVQVCAYRSPTLHLLSLDHHGAHSLHW